jgi:UDP-N-acetylglucosamine 2-epimerase (non-hydrolysing)
LAADVCEAEDPFLPLRVLAVVGTRPEAIKMAPIVLRLRREPESFAVVLLATAQHRGLLDSPLETFGLRPDVDLDLMRPDQTLNGLCARLFDRIDEQLVAHRPDWVLVQGDTTTAMGSALAAFHRRIPVAHVEAGLRTGDLGNPFPEEMNRRVTDLLASAHFAPTRRSAEALLAEGVASSQVHVTGNPVVDALLWIARRDSVAAADGKLVLVTAHRRESFGEPMRRAFRAVARLARRFPDHSFVLPVHPNPRVSAVIDEMAGVPNVRLVEPAGYPQLVAWLRAARLVLTDSGGIQEEAPTFGKPVLVLRDTTERPEGVERGVARLVGTDERRIFDEAEKLLSDASAYAAMSSAGNPYGDGRAADRIAAVLAGRPFEPFAG